MKTLTDSQYWNAALRLYASDDVAIDDCSSTPKLVARAEKGAWVRAWVWVPNEEAAKEATVSQRRVVKR